MVRCTGGDRDIETKMAVFLAKLVAPIVHCPFAIEVTGGCGMQNKKDIGRKNGTVVCIANLTRHITIHGSFQSAGAVVPVGIAIFLGLVLLSACSDDNSGSAGAAPASYTISCMPCHGEGLGGAPKTGDTAAWEARIAKGMGKVRRNAIEGFEGGTGVMPAKGGRLDMSDDEIIALVDYMVEASR